MRAALTLTASIVLAGCWEVEVKDAPPPDDSGAVACRAGTAPVDASTVIFTDLIVDGLAFVPTVDGLCASADGLTVRMDFTVDGEAGVLSLAVTEPGVWAPDAAAVTDIEVRFDGAAWRAADLYAGSVGFEEVGAAMEGAVEVEGTAQTRNLYLSLRWSVPRQG